MVSDFITINNINWLA